MDYQKPAIMTSFITADVYAAASGFTSIGDDGAHCTTDSGTPGTYDAVCS